jgi:hypothetical protein
LNSVEGKGRARNCPAFLIRTGALMMRPRGTMLMVASLRVGNQNVY